MNQNSAYNRPTQWSIGTLLIWAVNLPLVVALGVLLPLDYRGELENAIAQKHASLEQEAMVIHQGLSCLAEKGGCESVQRYVNTFCAHMQESRSPGHHIAVLWNDSYLEAEAHRLTSPETARAMQQAAESPNHRAAVGDETLVIGTFAGNGMKVYVSENTTNIRRSIQREILLHLGSLAALALAAAAIINVVLWRIVARPVRHLSNTVSRIARGDYELRTNGLRSREMNELASAIQQMAETLAANECDRRSHMDQARRIQEHLLPNGVTIPGLAVARLFQPADEVSGDYYELIRLPDGTWLVCVADVTGHGMAAAMGSAMLKALVMHAVERHWEPPEILSFTNERLPALLPEQFTTMFLARWDPQNQRLDYASAGHEPALLLSPNGEVRQLPATGLPLGVLEAAEWHAEEIDFPPGSRLLLTTDGVAETSAPHGELFGRERLARLVANSDGRSPSEIIESIREAVSGHQAGARRTDDVTVLALEAVVRTPSIIAVSRAFDYNTARKADNQPRDLDTHD